MSITRRDVIRYRIHALSDAHIRIADGLMQLMNKTLDETKKLDDFESELRYMETGVNVDENMRLRDIRKYYAD